MKHTHKLAFYFLVLFQGIIFISSSDNKLKQSIKNEKKTNLKKESARFKEVLSMKSSQNEPSAANVPPSHLEQEAQNYPTEAQLAESQKVLLPDLPEQMPHELEEQLQAISENQGIVNSGNENMPVPIKTQTNIDDMIKNDPILGDHSNSKITDDNTYREEFSPLDFF